MTTPQRHDRTTIGISGPDALIAAAPYLVGFRPTNSVVAVWCAGDRHEIVLTARMDLPPDDAPDEAVAAIASSMLAPLRALPRDARPFLIAFPDAAEPEGHPLPGARAVTVLERALDAAGRPPIDALCVVGERWWSYLCDTLDNCDLCGQAVDESTRLEVAALFVATGRAPVADRSTMVAELAPARAALVRRMRGLIADTGCPTGERRGARPPELSVPLRAMCWSAMRRLVEGSPQEQAQLDDVARLLVGLRDVHLRDAFITLVQRQQAPHAVATLAWAVTLAPARFIAPAAGSLAMLRYLQGDGARAWAALDRCWADDPDYSLATLVASAVAAGMPPDGFREIWSAFDPDDLRHRRVKFGAA